MGFVGGGDFVKAQSQGMEERALSILQRLVSTHPKEEIREELQGWIRSGKVHVALSNRIPSMSAGFMRGTRQETLSVNPTFMFGTWQPSTAEDWKYKQLVIYHEHRHFREHFNGEVFFVTQSEFQAEAPVETAERQWRGELSAELATWNFAKEAGIQHLMPRFQRAVAGLVPS